MNTDKLHFTIGEDFGKLITSIAREKLIYEFNPSKAIETIKGSLIGCPLDIALKVIKGNIVLVTDKDNASINAIEYKLSMKNEYPPLDMEDICEKWLLDMKKSSKEWSKSISELVKSVIEEDNSFNITVKYDSLIRFFYEGEKEDILDMDNDIIYSIKCLVFGVKNFIDECFKKMKVIKWMHNNYPDEIPEEFLQMPIEVRDVYTNITDIMTKDGDIDAYIARNKIVDDTVSKYIEDEKNIQKTLEEVIQPVNILDGYDAGWLAPNGNFYGLNGGFANMLHIRIADALLKANVIPKEEGYERNPDVWLSENGWVKIHNCHILYDGYIQSRYGKPLIPLTDIQRENIEKYGQVCCNGMLQFGLSYQFCYAAKFGMMDEFMIRKLFDM